MGVELRPLTAVALLILVLVIGLSGAFAVTESVSEPYDPAGDTIELDGDDRELWLYTSRAQSFDQYTLALNVLVYGSPDATERRLTDGQWEALDADDLDTNPERDDGVLESDPTAWAEADGATRYVYLTAGSSDDVQDSAGDEPFDEPDEGGVWLTEAYQLHDGSYLGSRNHIRAYTAPDNANWTAVQSHAEYWDWFSARHIVTSVEESQTHVEEQFADEDQPLIKTRVGGEDRSDFDGWITIVDPRDGAPLPGAIGLLAVIAVGAVSTRVSAARSWLTSAQTSDWGRVLGVGGALVATYLGVRLAAVWLEGLLSVAPKLIAGLVYPIIFVGLPVVAYLGSRQLPTEWAFTGAAVGFGTATLLDFTYLGVTALPLSVFVHRGGLAVALGLIAVGATREYRTRPATSISYVQVGVLLWVVASAQPLLRFTPLPV